MSPLIQSYYDQHNSLIEILEKQGEISLISIANDTFRRTLVLSIASYFEHEVCELLRKMTAARSTQDEIVCSFVNAKGIQRQYHTYFQWGGNNANQFFSLFGRVVRDKALKDIQENPDLLGSVRAFLELGALRNQLVHQKFLNFTVEKTPEEIIVLYRKATHFVVYLHSLLFPVLDD